MMAGHWMGITRYELAIERKKKGQAMTANEFLQSRGGFDLDADSAPLPTINLDEAMPVVSDPVNQPAHYTGHPSGIECIQVTEHMGFNIGNAVKYLWRCDLKNDAIEDLKKAAWYIAREIAKREKAAA